MRGPKINACVPEGSGGVVKDAMLDVNIRGIIDSERRVAGIFAGDISHGNLASLENEDAFAAAGYVQIPQAYICAAVSDADCADVIDVSLDVEVIHGNAARRFDQQNAVYQIARACAWLRECGARKALECQIIKARNLNKFGAGTLHENGDRQEGIQFRQCLIQRLAAAAIDGDGSRRNLRSREGSRK